MLLLWFVSDSHIHKYIHTHTRTRARTHTHTHTHGAVVSTHVPAMDTDGLKRSYTSVQLHGGIVMQCANDSKHPARTQAEQFVDWLELCTTLFATRLTALPNATRALPFSRVLTFITTTPGATFAPPNRPVCARTPAPSIWAWFDQFNGIQ